MLISSPGLALAARWAWRGAWTGLLVAVALPLTAFLVDIGLGREVLLISPHDPKIVTLNRSLWNVGDPVAEVYGNPMSEPIRVLLVPGLTVLHPDEDAKLSLVPVTAEASRPIQVRTLWWAVRLGEAGVGMVTVALLGFGFFARRLSQDVAPSRSGRPPMTGEPGT